MKFDAITVRCGGMSKLELLAELGKHDIQLNQAGLALFTDERFTTSPVSFTAECVQVNVGDLGLPQGAVIAQIHERAAHLGLSCGPLELGPHLRLQLLDQPEGSRGERPSKHRAPPGSITVASEPLADDDETPKGFYLRRIDGVLWLRGYRSRPEHLWSPEDCFVFCRRGA